MNSKPHKYRAVRTEVDGISFASKREAKRYSELKLLEKAGEIEALEMQPKFPITVMGEKIATYIADFRYRLVLNKARRLTTPVVEDVKGFKTPAYRLKKKLVEALYGITITEVSSR